MEDDDRSEETRKEFPLRKIRLDLCRCGHDDSDHQTELNVYTKRFYEIKDGACSLCVCKGFELPIKRLVFK